MSPQPESQVLISLVHPALFFLNSDGSFVKPVSYSLLWTDKSIAPFQHPLHAARSRMLPQDEMDESTHVSTLSISLIVFKILKKQEPGAPPSVCPVLAQCCAEFTVNQ